MALLALLAVVWAIVGVHGAFSYGNSYLIYRGFPPPKDPPGIAKGHLLHEHFWSPALRARRAYLVYTPPGYSAAAAHGQRFPVMYLLHGAPGSPSQFINVAHAGVDLDTGIAKHRLRPFLLVMPDGSNGTFRSETEWANSPKGKFESLVLETVHNVDSRFPTLRNRRFRAIAGNSEGAYAAINISLHHLGMFGIAEGWSAYLWQTRTTAFKHATDAQLRANDPSLYIPTLGHKLRRFPLHAFIYKGTREQAVVKAHAQAVASELAHYGGHVTFRIYKGRHDWRIWRQQTPRMLRYASFWFGRVK